MTGEPPLLRGGVHKTEREEEETGSTRVTLGEPGGTEGREGRRNGI